MKGKRSGVDFSKHVLTVIENDHVLIHKLWQKDTCCYGITFINAEGILSVTGDCGNWIFCREFHPSKDGYVSDSYWCEKLKISSTQNPYQYDADETEIEIKERLQDEEITTEVKDYLEDILSYTHAGEFWYRAKAHNELPDGYEHEDVPFCQDLSPMLKVVFDAFDEICRRMKDGEI